MARPKPATFDKQKVVADNRRALMAAIAVVSLLAAHAKMPVQELRRDQPAGQRITANLRLLSLRAAL